MTPTITDDEYSEYQHLKGIYTRELIQKSLDSVTRLEDDIDAPIKRCVMALALLGCEPRWSCCGFDYAGQPLHKDHDYGSTHFVMKMNKVTDYILTQWFSSQVFMRDAWRATPHLQDGVTVVSLSTQSYNTAWANPHSIHYSELGATHTKRMEDFLLSFSDFFMDVYTLKSTNTEYRSRFPWWQYPSKEDWVITKEDLLA